ncbi:MAG: hypothetical protein AB2728_17530 [Candidatus Thiodiazotropha sp.]
MIRKGSAGCCALRASRVRVDRKYSQGKILNAQFLLSLSKGGSVTSMIPPRARRETIP